jgi:polar amino acid transport system substrate-binding protein
MSRPYHRSGVALAVGAKSSVASLADLQSGQRVGVQVGSIASMIVSKRGIETSPFAFEDDIMEALAKGEIAAAAVTPAAIGWFNKIHPDGRVRRVAAFEADPNLNWNVPVGMIGPDEKLTRVSTPLETCWSTARCGSTRYGINCSSRNERRAAFAG